jgi:hypothetical protein
MGSECMSGRLDGGIEWTQLAEDRDRLRALVYTVMNVCVPAPRSVLLKEVIAVCLQNEKHKKPVNTKRIFYDY